MVHEVRRAGLRRKNSLPIGEHRLATKSFFLYDVTHLPNILKTAFDHMSETNPQLRVTFVPCHHRLYTGKSPPEGTEGTEGTERQSSKPCAVTPFTHRSDMWAAGVVILELYAGGLEALESGCGENATALLESISRKAKGSYGGAEAGDQYRAGCGNDRGVGNGSGDCSVGEGGVPDAGDADEDVGERGRTMGGEKNTCHVDVPDDVLAVLRDMLTKEPRARPSSMEVGDSGAIAECCISCVLPVFG